MSALATKREGVVTALGTLLKSMNTSTVSLPSDPTDYTIARQTIDILTDAEKLVRGPDNCEWKNTVRGLRQLMADWLEGRDNSYTVRWALTQWLVYLAYALDTPARVIKPRPALDPNSETYRCM